MSIQGISLRVFERTREFFKYNPKTGNKRYVGDAPKRLRRQAKLEVAGPRIEWIQENVKPGKTLFQYGHWLHQQRRWTAGNCGEMSCVAFYLFSLEQEQNPAPQFPVRFVGVESPGSHAFLVAGYLPPFVADEPPWEWLPVSVDMMCNTVPEMSDSYVVDVWAGIFCRTRAYPFELRQKMSMWSGQRKEVMWDNQWRDPAPADEDRRNYAADILRSHILIADPADAL